MTLGWGISDIPGWIEAVLDYYNVMKAIPAMIRQMPILVRSINLDGVLATEGAGILSNVDLENTVKIREASLNNSINMDIVGDLKAIQRDFKEVPDLLRLIRQHVGGCSGIAEEIMWSIERGAFSSGDMNEGAQEKLWENNKYIHRDVAYQCKNIAMLEVVNALGTDRDVLEALPYTYMEFDNPVVANAEARARIARDLGQTMVDFTASGVPVDAGMEIVSSYSDDEFQVRSNLLEDLKRRQAILDEREKEKHEKEMEQLEAQIRLTNEQAENAGIAPAGGVSGGGAKGKVFTTGSGGEGYTKLEQRKHEKTRGTAARRESIQRH
jgi:hypothetical protein